MTNMNFPLAADSNLDDLPRTLRREHEARAREAQAAAASIPPQFAPRQETYEAPSQAVEAAVGTVTRFDVPFLHLVTFFLKAALAAIPALLLLGALLWLVGQALEEIFPELIKMKILISFPT